MNKKEKIKKAKGNALADYIQENLRDISKQILSTPSGAKEINLVVDEEDLRKKSEKS